VTRPNVFNIPASAPFLPVLVDALREGRLVPGFPENDEPLALAVSDFLSCAMSGSTPLSDGWFSLRVLEVLEAGEQSLRSGGMRIAI